MGRPRVGDTRRGDGVAGQKLPTHKGTRHSDGRRHVARLTLGALAEIETGLGVDGLEDVAARMKTLSARDLMVVLAAVLVAVLVVLFGLPALTMVGLVATVLVFVVLIAYATGY